MPVLGITGGIGMGKSTAAGILTSLGIPVVDTDQIARELVVPGAPALSEIRERLGAGWITSSGSLDRTALAAWIFTHPEKRRILEDILHPRIAQSWRASVQQWRVQGRSGAVIIPLLFEKGYESDFDSVASVVCSERTQRARLQDRGWDSEQIAGRLAAQWPVGEKVSRSQVMIWTEGSLRAHHDQWRRVLETRISANDSQPIHCRIES
jgi:dephospho-CoA kinase